VTAAASQVTTKPPGRRTRRDSAHKPENRHSRGEGRRAGEGLVRIGRREHATHEPLITRAMLAAVPLAGLSFGTPTDARIFHGKLTRRRAANPLNFPPSDAAATILCLWPHNQTLKGFPPWLTALMHWFG
jgi:hypothetical protein